MSSNFVKILGIILIYFSFSYFVAGKKDNAMGMPENAD